jgi:hypothetical protein
MLRVGGVYRYRVGSHVNATEFEIITKEDYYYIGRSLDSFEVRWFFNNNGQQIGTEHSGFHTTLLDVWLLL